MRLKILFLLALSLGLASAITTRAQVKNNGLYCYQDDNRFVCRLDQSPVVSARLISHGGLLNLVTPGDFSFAAQDAGFLLVRARVKVENPYFRLSFLNKKQGAVPLEDLSFHFRPSSKFQNYYFDLSQSAFWRGRIDGVYFAFDNNNIEIQSVRISRNNLNLQFLSLIQEYLSGPSRNLSWINFLPPIYLNGLPFSYYYLTILFIIWLVLWLFCFRSNDFRLKWPKIFLFVILIAWSFLEIRFLVDNFYQISNSYNLRHLSPQDRNINFINNLSVPSDQGKQLYGFLDLVHKKIPVGAKIFIPPSSDYSAVFLTYNLINQYQLVKQINAANYLLAYNSDWSDLVSFRPFFKVNNQQLIYIRK